MDLIKFLTIEGDMMTFLAECSFYTYMWYNTYNFKYFRKIRELQNESFSYFCFDTYLPKKGLSDCVLTHINVLGVLVSSKGMTNN